MLPSLSQPFSLCSSLSALPSVLVRHIFNKKKILFFHKKGMCLVPKFFVFFLTGMLNPDVTSDASSLIATAIAQGFALFVAVFMAFDVSGGHVNPAVTFAFALGGHISVPVAIFYWISQMVAATLACLLLRVASAGQVRTTPFLYNTCFLSELCELLQ